ncbi:hypothetical protein EQ500_15585 [Lactobacillus sp. XV13L]|nr:hypothetical protein [Lactobacillus sp. XV13L]
MKKNILKRLIVASGLVFGLTGTVNVMADTIDPQNVDNTEYIQTKPMVEAIKSYTFERYANSSTQLNKRAFTYVLVPPTARSTYKDKQQTWYVSRANTFIRTYSYTGGY